jgi:hypothetical protein
MNMTGNMTFEEA